MCICFRHAAATSFRVSESTLQGLAFIGGSPGAFWAQRYLRHKISKARFLKLFGIILLAQASLAALLLRTFWMNYAAIHIKAAVILLVCVAMMVSTSKAITKAQNSATWRAETGQLDYSRKVVKLKPDAAAYSGRPNAWY